MVRPYDDIDDPAGQTILIEPRDEVRSDQPHDLASNLRDEDTRTRIVAHPRQSSDCCLGRGGTAQLGQQLGDAFAIGHGGVPNPN